MTTITFDTLLCIDENGALDLNGSQDKKNMIIELNEATGRLLNELANQEHIGNTELVERLIKMHSEERERRKELKAFFKPYQKNLTGFVFDREEANAR